MNKVPASGDKNVEKLSVELIYQSNHVFTVIFEKTLKFFFDCADSTE